MDEQQKDLLRLAGDTARALCTPCRATWWRWRTGKTRVPLAVLNLLRILTQGELPQGGPAWTGWRFVRGALVDPAGVEHTPATITAWWWTAQKLQLRRAEENELAQRLPANVVQLEHARPAHRLTAALGRRLEEVSTL